MAAANAAVRRTAAAIAANSKWATTDRRAGTSAARAGFMRKFELEVDPDGLMPPAERALRAESAMKAHMGRLALRSRKARST